MIRFKFSSLGPFLLSAAKLQAGPRLQDSRERFALEAEAESLRQSVEKMAMEVVVVAAAFLFPRSGCACGGVLVMTVKKCGCSKIHKLDETGTPSDTGLFLLIPSTQTYSVDWEGTLY